MSLAGLVATGFGSGLSPKAPGTVGSAVACFLALFLPGRWLIGALVVCCAAGIWASTKACEQWGLHDPGKIVIDEWAGQWLTLAGHGAMGWLVPCFVLFRLFDILKPWPVSLCEKLPRGWGIMADDLMAGLLANLTLSLLRFLVGSASGYGGLVWMIFGH